MPFAQAWSAILPLRWYMAVLLGQAHGDCRSRNPLFRSRTAGLTMLFAGRIAAHASLEKTKGCLRRRDPPSNGNDRTPRGLGGAFMAEWRAARNAERLQRAVLAPLVYGFIIRNPI